MHSFCRYAFFACMLIRLKEKRWIFLPRKPVSCYFNTMKLKEIFFVLSVASCCFFSVWFNIVYLFRKNAYIFQKVSEFVYIKKYLYTYFFVTGETNFNIIHYPLQHGPCYQIYTDLFVLKMQYNPSSLDLRIPHRPYNIVISPRCHIVLCSNVTYHWCYIAVTWLRHRIFCFQHLFNISRILNS